MSAEHEKEVRDALVRGVRGERAAIVAFLERDPYSAPYAEKIRRCEHADEALRIASLPEVSFVIEKSADGRRAVEIRVDGRLEHACRHEPVEFTKTEPAPRATPNARVVLGNDLIGLFADGTACPSPTREEWQAMAREIRQRRTDEAHRATPTPALRSMSRKEWESLDADLKLASASPTPSAEHCERCLSLPHCRPCVCSCNVCRPAPSSGKDGKP